MKLSLMIEGQEGVTWPQWMAIAQACEEAQLEGLFRSDHYSGFIGGQGGALDAWATLSALAAVTSRIQLGTLVSPVTFRHPSVVARMVATVSHVSGGRVELGLGAGWNEAEHREHGFPFPPMRERLELLNEHLEVIRRSWDDERFDFSGRHISLEGCAALPKPVPGGVNLIVGGQARPGTVEAAVRFADEYNSGYASPEEARRRRIAIEEACARAGREPLRFSLTMRCTVGESESALQGRLDRIAQLTGSFPLADSPTTITGTVARVVEQLREYERAGVARVMLQHFLHEDTDMIRLLGREVVPHFG